jgi:peptidoglycan/LPS O-acetylase OafA/YrhL
MDLSKEQNKAQSALVHYDYLDGIRAVLALYVVAHHSFLTVRDHDRKGLNICFEVFNYGFFAVCFFIVLSGFCLFLPVLGTKFTLKNGSGAFFKRRAWRILPPYYAALLLSLLLIYLFVGDKTGVRWDSSLPVTVHNLVTHFLLIHNLFQSDYHKINYVFWSVALEWQIYFLFPALLFSWRRIGPFFTTFGVVTVVFLGGSVFTVLSGIRPDVDFVALFALGMLAAWISFSPGPVTAKLLSWPWQWISAVCGIAAIALYRSQYLGADILFGCFASSVLIVASSQHIHWLRRLLNFKPLIFVGSFSYSLYLIHAPLIQLLWKYVFSSMHTGTNLTCIILLALGIPIIVAVSYLFYLCFERPFIMRKDRKLIHVADTQLGPAATITTTIA